MSRQVLDPRPVVVVISRYDFVNPVPNDDVVKLSHFWTTNRPRLVQRELRKFQTNSLKLVFFVQGRVTQPCLFIFCCFWFSRYDKYQGVFGFSIVFGSFDTGYQKVFSFCFFTQGPSGPPLAPQTLPVCPFHVVVEVPLGEALLGQRVWVLGTRTTTLFEERGSTSRA